MGSQHLSIGSSQVHCLFCLCPFYVSLRFMYWDSAPSYSLLIVYPPLFFLYPEVRTRTATLSPDPPPISTSHLSPSPPRPCHLQAGGVLLKTLLLSLAVTLVIWFFPFDAIGWEPTNDHVAITVSSSQRRRRRRQSWQWHGLVIHSFTPLHFWLLPPSCVGHPPSTHAGRCTNCSVFNLLHLASC